MYQQIKQVLPRSQKIKLLDLGCGYGRISKEILKEFPQSSTIGIDISDTYVNLYNKNLSPRGKAVIGNIKKLPFQKSLFDAVFVVTSLMYIIDPSDQKKVMREIFRVLKPEGRLVVIERDPRGYSLVTMGGLVAKLRGQKFKEIPAVSIEPKVVMKLVNQYGGQINSFQGIPILTLSLPLTIFISKINTNLTVKLLTGVSLLDKIFSRFLTPSLYIAYSCQKKR